MEYEQTREFGKMRVLMVSSFCGNEGLISTIYYTSWIDPCASTLYYAFSQTACKLISTSFMMIIILCAQPMGVYTCVPECRVC